jgi:hypothetical protein
MGADRGPERQEQRQWLQAAAVACVVEIAVEQDRGEQIEAAELQIHDQEGEDVQDVDLGQGVTKLNRVEQDRPAVVHDDVAQVQIAMAAADKTGAAAAIDHRRARGEQLAREFAQAPSLGHVQHASRHFGKTAGVALDQGGETGRITAAGFHRRPAVEGCDLVGHAFHDEAVKAPFGGKTVEEPALLEARHLHQPIDGGPTGTQPECSIRTAADRHHAEIQRRCQRLIDAHLGLAEMVPAFACRVVKVRILYGPLELVRPRADQKDDRSVCLVAFDRLFGGTERLAARQEGDHLALIFDNHGEPPSPRVSSQPRALAALATCAHDPRSREDGSALVNAVRILVDQHLRIGKCLLDIVHHRLGNRMRRAERQLPVHLQVQLDERVRP